MLQACRCRSGTIALLVFSTLLLALARAHTTAGAEVPSVPQAAPYLLHGQIADTVTSFEQVDSLANAVFPVLQNLLNTTAFRYYKMDLYRDCPFWTENRACSNRNCAVVTTDDDRIKQMWNDVDLGAIESLSVLRDSPFGSKECRMGDKDFCLVGVQPSDTAAYIDLQMNPERYTGYTGDSARRVWSAIYEQNCFPFVYGTEGNQVKLGTPLAVDELCVEKRTFYRVISGLHTSISIHICDQHLDKSTDTWGPDLECFDSRVGKFEDRQENVYFLYTILLQALTKSGRFLNEKNYCTGDVMADYAVENTLDTIHSHIEKEGPYFQQSALFTGEMLSLKEEFRDRFRNISRILDCVGCDKCRLWGRMQVGGIGTALKILFSFDDEADIPLRRSELVALYNVFGRISESIVAIENFRRMHAEKYRFRDNLHPLSRHVVNTLVEGVPVVDRWMMLAASDAVRALEQTLPSTLAFHAADIVFLTAIGTALAIPLLSILLLRR